MYIIEKKGIIDHCLMDLYSQRHDAEAKLSFFVQKYGCSFDAFEKQQSAEKEVFEQWDDYLEWKACEKNIKSIQQDIEDIKSEHFKIAA